MGRAVLVVRPTKRRTTRKRITRTDDFNNEAAKAPPPPHETSSKPGSPRSETVAFAPSPPRIEICPLCSSEALCDREAYGFGLLYVCKRFASAHQPPHSFSDTTNEAPDWATSRRDCSHFRYLASAPIRSERHCNGYHTGMPDRSSASRRVMVAQGQAPSHRERSADGDHKQA